jgi:hypothetical protein
VLLPASSALAVAPTDGSCIGQFFSSHAGLATAHTKPRNVGEFTSVAAQDLGSEFGATISVTATSSSDRELLQPTGELPVPVPPTGLKAPGHRSTRVGEPH